MRNSTLAATLEAFTRDVAAALAAETAAGAEIPFEVAEAGAGPGRAALYCYRPLTSAFIGSRLGLLRALASYPAAARALETVPGIEAYLDQRGVTPIPAEARSRVDATLRALLERVFAERSEFAFDAGRFELAYQELERALYAGRSVSTVIAPLLGLALDPATAELALGDGLSLTRGEALPDAPAEAIWGTRGLDMAPEPNVLAVLSVDPRRARRPPLSLARSRFRRILTALRLYERGGYALGPLAWIRADEGVWRPVVLGGSGRPGLVTLIPAAHEDELRAFCSLVASRSPSPNELAWALARFEMGRERLAPFEALTDYLLALRALLEPEGPHSGRLAQRLAMLCAVPEGRGRLAERTAHAISLERAVISGLAPAATGIDELVEELSEHLRALLRDVICGHLDADLRALADELLGHAAAAPSEAETLG